METFQQPRFFNDVVGGEKLLNNNQTQNQIKILQSQQSFKQLQNNQSEDNGKKKEINLYNTIQKNNAGKEVDDAMTTNMKKKQHEDKNKYNPIDAWKEQHGLIGDTNSRFDVHYLHIDSSYRQINPMMEVEQYFSLSLDPISTTELSTALFISQPNHPFQVEDKITIDGIAPNTHQLRFVPNYKNFNHLKFNPSDAHPVLEFIEGESYATLYINHGIPEGLATTNSVLLDSYVLINNFTNAGSLVAQGEYYYGNVKLSYINSAQNFFLVDSARGITFSSNKLYIDLPANYALGPGIPSADIQYFNVTLYYVKSIPTYQPTPIEFTVGKNYMTIYFNHGIPQNYATDPELSNLYIQISNFTNNNMFENKTYYGNPLYYGNIPLTFINNVHSFFLENTSEGLTYNANIMYASLPYAYDITPGTPTISSSYFNISLYYVNGIPMNAINAKYPTDIYHNLYYQVISNVTDDGYYIDIKPTYALSSGAFGGRSIRIGQVSDFSGGYVEPNNYIIPLERIYKNVISVRLLSTEFPNSEYVVKSSQTGTQNNKLYWQNYEDGSYVYSLEIPSGKYDPTTLASVLDTQFYNTPRYYYPSVTQNYTNHNYVRVSIDPITDTTTISSLKQAVMVRPFVGMYYIVTNAGKDHAFEHVASVPAGDPSDPTQLYPLFINIHYPKHGLTLNTSYETHVAGQDYVPNGTTGDNVILTGVTTYQGVPGSKIDGTYEAYAQNAGLVPQGEDYSSEDYFMIKLNPMDIGYYAVRGDGQFGGIFNMYIPNKFRLLFSYPDTIGELLGFSNVGETYAVTKYAYSITNKEAYQPDISPAVQTDTISPGNSVILSGHNYILMKCQELPVIESIGKIKDAFAKILLVGIPGKTCFNTFVSTPKIFYEPIQELSQLTLSFYSPDEDLYDFNGLEHSFTIEIITLDELPFDTHINTHTGKML